MAESGRKSSKPRRAVGRGAQRLKGFDTKPGVVKAAQALRRALPGDTDYGDPLSVAGGEPTHLLGKRLSELAAENPSAMNEVGMGALQAWQSLSEARGRGKGSEEFAIVFTDLVAFSDWALAEGDEKALELLRKVGQAVEPVLEGHGGRVVKRLGDGLMAVFDDPGEAVQAALEASFAVSDVELDCYSPTLRAGVHLGKPRKLGGDYFGVDVNVAARVADAARGEEVLVTDAIRDRLGEDRFKLSRRRFKAKGAPKDLTVFAAR